MTQFNQSLDKQLNSQQNKKDLIDKLSLYYPFIFHFLSSSESLEQVLL